MSQSKASKLERLSRITALKLAIRQSEMAKLIEIENNLKRQISNLDDTVRQRAVQLANGPDEASRTGVDLRWQSWTEQQRDKLLAELSRTLAQREERRADLNNAFARDQVVGKITDASRSDLRSRTARRVDNRE